MLDLIIKFLTGGPAASPSRRRRRPSSRSTRPRGPRAKSSDWPHGGNDSKYLTVYHGTSNLENARSIVRQGWVVGQGNAHGDGVYTTTDRAVASQYAGAAGYIVRARLYAGKVAQWNAALDRSFQAWCNNNNCAADMSARTAFLLAKGYRTLREGNVYIVLLRAYRNPAATKFRLKRLRVDTVEQVSTGRRVAI